LAQRRAFFSIGWRDQQAFWGRRGNSECSHNRDNGHGFFEKDRKNKTSYWDQWWRHPMPNTVNAKSSSSVNSLWVRTMTYERSWTCPSLARWVLAFEFHSNSSIPTRLFGRLHTSNPFWLCNSFLHHLDIQEVEIRSGRSLIKQ
jgi:hypothetical protein